MEFAEAMEMVAQGFELVGVAILFVGGVWAGVLAVRDAVAKRPVYTNIRRRFGKALLLGLEVLVAADIIKTVTIATTLETVAALGILVIVRTLLSFSLDIEIEGILPWRRTDLGGQGDSPAVS